MLVLCSRCPKRLSAIFRVVFAKVIVSCRSQVLCRLLFRPLQPSVSERGTVQFISNMLPAAKCKHALLSTCACFRFLCKNQHSYPLGTSHDVLLVFIRMALRGNQIAANSLVQAMTY